LEQVSAFIGIRNAPGQKASHFEEGDLLLDSLVVSSDWNSDNCHYQAPADLPIENDLGMV
jgi:hypothetical protein